MFVPSVVTRARRAVESRKVRVVDPSLTCVYARSWWVSFWGKSYAVTMSRRGSPRALLFLIVFLSACATYCAAPVEVSLTAGVVIEGTTTKDQARFFQFVLGPNEDAELTLAVTDGDADVYVLGPMFARFSGFGAGNVGAKSTNVDHFGADDNFNAYKWTWSSYKSAGSDEILYISSADPLKAGSITTNRTFRVGVWGWSEFGESGADGSEWRLSFAKRNHTAMVNSNLQAVAMQNVFTECCGVAKTPTNTNRCSPWRNKSNPSAAMDVCHVANNVCDENGVLRFLKYVQYCAFPKSRHTVFPYKTDTFCSKSQFQRLRPELRFVYRSEFAGRSRVTVGDPN